MSITETHYLFQKRLKSDMVLSLLHKQMNLFHYSCAQSPSVLCLLFSHRALSTIQLRALLISVPALHIAHKCKLVLSLPTCCSCWAWCCWQSLSGKVKSVDHVHLYFNPFHVRDSKLHEPTGLERTRLKMPAVDLQTEWKHRLCMQFWWECTGPALENKRLCVRVHMMMMMSASKRKEGESGGEQEASWLIMIDSFRAHSSFPPRSLAPALLYGLITETYSISHYLPSSVSHFFSSSFLSSSDNPPPPPILLTPPSTPTQLRHFIHPSPGKEAVNLHVCRVSIL